MIWRTQSISPLRWIFVTEYERSPVRVISCVQYKPCSLALSVIFEEKRWRSDKWVWCIYCLLYYPAWGMLLSLLSIAHIVISSSFLKVAVVSTAHTLYLYYVMTHQYIVTNLMQYLIILNYERKRFKRFLVLFFSA